MAAIDIHGTEQFERQVIERSREVAVLVDFWAAWCGPCRMLAPVLDKVVQARGAELELAKVDTDDPANRELAARYRITGIPAVKLFRAGQVAGEFTGALPESAVRAFIDQHLPRQSVRDVVDARARLAAGDRAGADTLLRRALEAEPALPAAHLELARLALADGDVAAARTHVDAIPPVADEAEAAGHVRDALPFARLCERAGGEAGARAQLAADPDDLAARYALAACLTVAGRHQEALDELLVIVERDRKWNDEAARKAMLTIFGLIGIRSEVSDRYRRKLAIYL